MNIYYIDYENVQSSGLEGVGQLTENDRVIILYSIHAETMRIDIVKQVMTTKADIQFVEADLGTPNALDFQLITSLFSTLLPENQYYIVSRDNGYDAAIKMSRRLGRTNIKRISSIRKSFYAQPDPSAAAAPEDPKATDTAQKKEPVSKAPDVSGSKTSSAPDTKASKVPVSEVMPAPVDSDFPTIPVSKATSVTVDSAAAEDTNASSSETDAAAEDLSIVSAADSSDSDYDHADAANEYSAQFNSNAENAAEMQAHADDENAAEMQSETAETAAGTENADFLTESCTENTDALKEQPDAADADTVPVAVDRTAETAADNAATASAGSESDEVQPSEASEISEIPEIFDTRGTKKNSSKRKTSSRKKKNAHTKASEQNDDNAVTAADADAVASAAAETPELTPDAPLNSDTAQDAAAFSEEHNEIKDNVTSHVAHAAEVIPEISTILFDRCGEAASKMYYDLVVTALKKSGNKNQFYQFFRKNLGEEKGKALYYSIRNKYDEMKALI